MANKQRFTALEAAELVFNNSFLENLLDESTFQIPNPIICSETPDFEVDYEQSIGNLTETVVDCI